MSIGPGLHLSLLSPVEDAAADFLGMKSLMDLCCQAVANMIKGKSPQEFCSGNFHIGTTSNPGKDQKEN
ncbi:hypothetical protein CDL15_Pgr004395 [Punica granatum]|uniref:SKP1 component dimerisation domain-containing protein n=1 Tax=Punica granatum TaxID=22663 RepID=A0A218XGB4_PUNGR|nr:hypothetical protein CDL15_Pgr004395 [Punica granatum]